MRKTKIATPVLLYLVILLLIVLVYYNFAFKPLQAKVDALRAENNLLKMQRLEIELAMQDEEMIKEEIEKMRALLEEDPDYTLVDGNNLTDDIYRNAKALGIGLRDIIITGPELVNNSRDQESLLKVTANIGFEASFSQALEFIKSFEESNTGAYLVDSLEIIGSDANVFDYKLSLSLYYYGSYDSDQEERNGVWTQ